MKKELTLEEIQQIEYSLLCQFADYCDTNELRYYLAGGTLLGAIRHQGFIPWDDDIDIMMPRPDYESLLQLLSQGKTDFAYSTVSLGAGTYPFLKLVDLHTHINLYYVTENECDNHLWIDIFPIDGLPESNFGLNFCFRIQKLLRLLMGISKANLGVGSTKVRAVAKIPLHPFAKLIGPKRLGLLLDRFSKRLPFDQSKYVGCLVWGYGPQERMLKEEWTQPVKVKFREREFWAPSNWDTYLTNLYGDYMCLPPVEKRAFHHIRAWKEEEVL